MGDIFEAISNGNLDEVKRLVEQIGADVNQKKADDNWTPLMSAINYSDNIEIVKFLLDKGADVRARANSGWDAAYVAAQYGHVEELKLLVARHGAELLKTRDDDGRTLLMAAQYSGDKPEIIRYLLSQGASIHDKDNSGASVIQVTAKSLSLYKEQVEMLLDAGVDANFRDENDNGATVLMMLAENSDRAEIIDLLVERGAEIEAKDNSERTALIRAAEGGKPNAVEALLCHGANLDAAFENGTTALLAAAGKWNADVIKVLVQHGAKLEQKDGDGYTALRRAINATQRETIDALLSLGADVNTRDNEGTTPLMKLASWYGNGELINLLLDKGADLNATDNKGRSAVYLAKFPPMMDSPIDESLEALKARGAKEPTEKMQ